jgi:hypothetical protein
MQDRQGRLSPSYCDGAHDSCYVELRIHQDAEERNSLVVEAGIEFYRMRIGLLVLLCFSICNTEQNKCAMEVR